MENKFKFLQVIKKGVLATLVWSLSIAGLLILLTFGTIQIPFVQTELAKAFAKYLSIRTGYQVSLKSLNISWFDYVQIEGFQIKDEFDSTMIAGDFVNMDFNLVNMIIEKEASIEGLNLINTQFSIIKHNDSTSINISDFLNKLKGLKNPRDSSVEAPKPISIKKARFENTRVSVNDLRRPPPATSWDYYHFAFDSITGDLSDLMISGDTIRTAIDYFRAIDSQQLLDINSMHGEFIFTNQAMYFFDMELQVGQSIIADSVSFFYTNSANLSYFSDSVEVASRLMESSIHPNDIASFSIKALPLSEPLNVSAKIQGKVGRFQVTDMLLRFGKSSYAEGNVHLVGLPDVAETFMDIKMTGSRFDSEDMKPLFPQTYAALLDSIQTLNARASFLGFYNDFVASGNFQTAFGAIKSNLNLKLPYQKFNGSYKGYLQLEEFDLKKILGEQLGEITMRGSIDGSGFTKKTADFFLDANFDHLVMNNYDYKNIETKARFASQFFEGEFEINDPNLKFDMHGTVDLRLGRDKLNFTGSIDTLNLRATNLSSKNFLLKTKIDLDLEGLELDSLQGTARLNDFYLKNDLNEIKLDSIIVFSQINEDERLLSVSNELMELTANGDFNYSVLFKDLAQLSNEYKVILQNDSETLEAYFKEKPLEQPFNYEVDFELTIKDSAPFVQMISNDIIVGKNTVITGSFDHGETVIVDLHSHLDTLQLGKYFFYNNEVDISTSKIADATNVLSMVYLSSQNLQLSRAANFENLFFEAIWNDGIIDFNTNFEQIDTDNKASLSGTFSFLDDQYKIRLKPSDLVAIGNHWYFSDGNTIFIDTRGISFENFEISYQNQTIKLSGILSDIPDQSLEILIDNFDLESLNPLLTEKISGILNAKTIISGLYKDFLIQTDMNIDTVKLNDLLIGNINGLSEWEKENERLSLGLNVNREGAEIMRIDGFFYPSRKEQLDLKVNFEKAYLRIIQPFVKQNFSGIAGEATGNFNISGPLETPIIHGNGKIEKGAVHIDYLNTNYNFTGAFTFDKNEIGIKDVILRDVYNQTANASGTIFHNNLKNFSLGLSADLKNFQVINTTATDNRIYYGSLYATGKVSFEGPLNNLNISANAVTNKNTRIYIPLSQNTNVQQEDFITFLASDKKNPESTNVPLQTGKVNLKGLKLDFDLDITPDAYTELIFDIKSGDIIRGRGNGEIKLQINTDGDFLMFGDMEIATGGYNFTLKNIINKEFEIVSGSRISWFGNPYQGVMDINARYSQLTSLLPLLPDNSSDEVLNSPDARRKYPAIVLLNLKGPLLTPEIDFNIEIENYPETIGSNAVGPIVNAFKSKLSQDEQELKRQVFSLIILRRFSPENSFNVGGGQTLGSSVSEFISNQLSYWVSQVDENLEVDVDLTSLNQDAFNTFQLRLAYTLLNGRLKISRDGGFTNINNETDATSIVGDWTVEYLITNDGKLRAKMYNKTNYNTINRFLDSPNNTTTGFSLEYTKSFEDFTDLIFKARNKPKTPLPEETDIEQGDAILIEETQPEQGG
ncbi:MAG: translocation/assembly module TamB [Bacteroidetes bacterium]|nr:translocation/assembly module TamB [Bacteroidota bacterium]MDA1121069.1 translocation/assembly module TamB [Bacteroidota bacterium]